MSFHTYYIDLGLYKENLKKKLIEKYGHDQGYAKLIIHSRYLGGFSMGVFRSTQ